MILGIRHIIFDLGGVLLNLDYGATERAFAELGIEDFGARFSHLSQNSFFDDWETGRISTEAFIAGMQEAAGDVPLTAEQILHAWNAMLLDFPLRRLQILQQLSIHYDLFLLSNTNEVHEAAFNRILKEAHGLPSLGHFFDKVYYSHRVGARKPGKEIYQRILDENGLKAEQTLFIDDSPKNIEAAQSLGIRTILVEAGLGMEEIFRSPKPGDNP